MPCSPTRSLRALITTLSLLGGCTVPVLPESGVIECGAEGTQNRCPTAYQCDIYGHCCSNRIMCDLGPCTEEGQGCRRDNGMIGVCRRALTVLGCASR